MRAVRTEEDKGTVAVCSQTSLKLTGTPCSGPRSLPVEANSASSAFACARASENMTSTRNNKTLISGRIGLVRC